MILSDDRINHLSHATIKALKLQGGTIYPDETKALQAVKRALHEFGAILEVSEEEVRRKISTLKRNVPEGSHEWDILHRQYIEESLRKKGV
ncbi:MAG: DUF507 family protein [Deltaproteobacteria bacterium]|nr:DUF507 family protein [Deltaproteobacteria bacterium]